MLQGAVTRLQARKDRKAEPAFWTFWSGAGDFLDRAGRGGAGQAGTESEPCDPPTTARLSRFSCRVASSSRRPAAEPPEPLAQSANLAPRGGGGRSESGVPVPYAGIKRGEERTLLSGGREGRKEKKKKRKTDI